MSANLASPPLPLSPSPSPPPSPAPSPPPPSSRKLPPSERDFDIYDAIHIAGCSTWSQAAKHRISQTRVRQIIRRVVEWLGEVLPPQAKIAREQETHLARQIAADRFQRQYEHATTFWNETQQAKYAGLRIRITTAQARLGVVGGLLDGLAADCLEGLPVPAWAPVQEGEAPAEPNRDADAPADPASSWQAHPAAAAHPKSNIKNQKSPRSRSRAGDAMPVELRDPLSVNEITPEIVAARAAWGRPLHPEFIDYARQHGRLWPRPAADASPPDEDFSALPEESADSAPPAYGAATETHDVLAAYNTGAPSPHDAPTPLGNPSPPLLTTPDPLPVAVVKLTLHQPGAALEYVSREEVSPAE